MLRSRRLVASAVLFLLSATFFVVYFVMPYLDYQDTRRKTEAWAWLVGTPSFRIRDHAPMGIVVPILLAGAGLLLLTEDRREKP